MNSGVTAERVYDALKQRLLSGTILPGERLEPAHFAGDLASSVTPVREALHRLTGERLVETRASDGFHLPVITEAHLRDLYAWSAALLHLAVQGWPKAPATLRADQLAADAPTATAMLFLLIGRRSANGEHGLQVASVNDRLAASRAVEAQALGGVEAELRAMAMAFDHAGRQELLKQVRAYHRRRVAAAPAIVRALYHPAGNNRAIGRL